MTEINCNVLVLFSHLPWRLLLEIMFTAIEFPSGRTTHASSWRTSLQTARIQSSSDPKMHTTSNGRTLRSSNSS